MEKRKSHHSLEINNYKFWLDGYLYDNYKIILDEAIPHKWDGLIIVHGKEGTGKTTLSTQSCLFLDNDFNIKKTSWLPQQFEKCIDECPDESSILWDEAITGANASHWANSISQSVISKLTQIRKKRLKIIICFPYLNMLNKYFVSRCIASIYVYAKSFTDRGHAFFYNQQQTEYLYMLMKERYRLQPRKAYNVASKSFYFKFCKNFCLPEDQYDELKENARLMDNSKEDIWKLKFIKAINFIKETSSVPEFAKVLGISKNYLYELGKSVR